jgi:hypothetical protein
MQSARCKGRAARGAHACCRLQRRLRVRSPVSLSTFSLLLGVIAVVSVRRFFFSVRFAVPPQNTGLRNTSPSRAESN